MQRSCGILLPLFSLPSPHGIGSMGAAARGFIDFLHRAGQSYWQLLPLHPTGYGDSPYQPLSALAGNAYFIDLQPLVEQALLLPHELPKANYHSTEPAAPAVAMQIDYAELYSMRQALLQLAWERATADLRAQVTQWALRQGSWLTDYALFMACRQHFGQPWYKWENAHLRNHQPTECAHYLQKLEAQCSYYQFEQYIFFEQWHRLRRYAHSCGVKLIGDMPLYVGYDCAELWAAQHLFQLDEQGQPLKVSGVPPDAFSAEGQLWGHPLYDWQAMAQDGYAWWKQRLQLAQTMYDVLRLDHFRGLSEYWAIPYGSATARAGSWQRGPGMEFIRMVESCFPRLQPIAEDLGDLSEAALQLLHDSGWPGMRVLQFGLDGNAQNPHLPHNYPRQCVCYSGTHDNPTTAQWCDELDERSQKLLKDYLYGDAVSANDSSAAFMSNNDALNSELGKDNFAIFRWLLGSSAQLAILTMPDLLQLGEQARINTPATSQGNWRWRMEQLPNAQLADKLRHLCRLYARAK